MKMQEIEMQKQYMEKVKRINEGKNLKYYILTMGCKLNENDSEKIIGMLEKMGYSESKEINDAKLYIINTCCVRENAEEKLFGKLGELKKIKEAKNIIIAIGGCMMQEEHITDKIKRSYPFVDIVFGTHTLHKLPEDIYSAITKNAKIKDILDIDGEVIEGLPVKRENSMQASVTIMYGCNNFCTYCIVPYVRGRERSRKPEDILKEIKDLAKEGYKEITLLGQNVNAYGKDLGLGYDFATLLDKVAKIGIPRVRFMTSHPWDFNDAMIEVIKNNENIMPYIHLPLQSGSDAVLRKMNRRYTEESYMALFDKLKANLPDFAFTTDIIVAFPSETEEDFERTLNMVDHCKYDNAFTFIFSPREGTPTYNTENTIPEEEKKSRLMRLNEKVAYYANMNAQKYQDQIVEVLVDGPSKKNKEVMCGYSREYKMVNFIGDCKEGDIVQVKITKANSFSLNGEMVK